MQEELKRRVLRRILQEEEKTATVKVGWYTERQMKEQLKMNKP